VEIMGFEAVSLSEHSSSSGRKYFSIIEANRALTLVRRVVQDIVNDYRRLRELHESCRSLDARGRTADAERARQDYASMTDHLSELKEELEKIGCSLKDYHLGLVDFITLHEGREVCLCWKLGEEKVGYWHECDSGYAARQPITEAFECPGVES
jgi:hypothetical protein